MRWLRHLPCAATLGNVAAGVLACGLAVQGHPELAALMILAAVLFDSVDGPLARSLSAESELGAELDSLADIVSFGVAPAVLAGSLLPAGLAREGWLLLLAFPLCAAWRLARFNVARGRQEEGEFSGLPSTGAGAAAATAILLHLRLRELGIGGGGLMLPWALLLLGMLMVSRIRYRHAGLAVARLTPPVAVALACLIVAGAVLWHYEYLFAALTWGYVAAAPLHVAGRKIRAVRHHA